MRKKWIVLGPVMIALFTAIGGQAVLHLWNWLMPALFGSPPPLFTGVPLKRRKHS